MLLPQKSTLQALPAGLEQRVLAPVPLARILRAGNVPAFLAVEDGVDHVRSLRGAR